MTTGKLARFRWTTLAVSLATACSLPAMAQSSPAFPPAPSPAASVPEVEQLYLEVVLNRVRDRRLRPFLLRDGRMLADAQALREIGLVWPGSEQAQGEVALDSLPGLRSEYDVADQRLLIDVPVALLAAPTAQVGYVAPPSPRLDPATRSPGLLLDYDLYGEGNGDYRTVSGWSEFRLFGVGPGVWLSSAVSRMSRTAASDSSGNTRLDTRWQLDFPDSMVSVAVGDGYSGGLDWTRTTRFGGIRVSRNFSLQPYRVTIPLASFAGEATLPSTVDMFINGVQQARREITPGRFQVDSAPVLNGVGNAQVVVTDITGQSRVVNFSFYNDLQLLQKGLADWSVETGYVRRDYGLRSFSYADDPMASGSLRYGVSSFLTAEAHLEGTTNLSMGGLGAMVLLGRAGGVLSGSYANSRYQDLDGRQYGFGYEWQGLRFSIGYHGLRRDVGFRDVASLESGLLPRRTDQAFTGLNFGRSQFGASYVRQDLVDGTRTTYASLSWSHQLLRFGNVSLSVNRDLDGDDGDSAYLYWSMPFRDNLHGWASAEHRNGGNTGTVGAMRALPGDEDGWGWRAQASAGEEAGGQAELSRLNRYGQWRLGALNWHGAGDNTTTGYFDASGALLLMKGRFFPMRRVYDAFALVSTDGIGEVPVMLENRLVGKTDTRGYLLVTPLNAWEENDLSIDPLVLPADVHVARTRMKAVPATDSGMLARFPMHAVMALELALRGPDGEWIAPGTEATLEGPDGSAPVVVGYTGAVYLESPPSGARIVVPLASGECVAVLPDQLPERGWIDLGVLPCRMP